MDAFKWIRFIFLVPAVLLYTHVRWFKKMRCGAQRLLPSQVKCLTLSSGVNCALSHLHIWHETWVPYRLFLLKAAISPTLEALPSCTVDNLWTEQEQSATTTIATIWGWTIAALVKWSTIVVLLANVRIGNYTKRTVGRIMILLNAWMLLSRNLFIVQ